jgi:hypothetical protein
MRLAQHSPSDIACGDTLYPITSTSTLSDGGTAYSYVLPTGTMTITVPPPSFSPSTASSSELALYGIEPFPANSAEQPAWEEMAANYHPVSAPPYIVVSANQVAPAATSGASGGSASSENWAGYITTSSSYATYTRAGLYYYEPSLYSSRCSSNAVVFWTGLGGWNTGDLAQIGTGYHLPGLSDNKYWYEVLPTEKYLIGLNFSSTPGYEQHVYVNYTLQPGTKVYAFEMSGYNYYNGQGETFYWDPFPSGGVTGIWDGSTADYIVERPTINGSLSYLSNFRSVDYTGYANGNTIATYGHDAVTMYDSSNTVMATPSSLTNGNEFTVTQDSCY